MTFTFTTLADEPTTAMALALILVLSVALEFGWKRIRDGSHD